MATQTQQPVEVVRTRRQFTVEEYARMLAAGVLLEGERVELMGGEVVRKPMMGSRHAGCIQYLDEEVRSVLPPETALRVQLPVTIPEYDEPEPDIAVVRRRADRYRDGHPRPVHVLLLIEVSDTTLASDQRVKLPVYARAGIPESWVVDINGEGIERHTDPDPTSGTYRSVVRFNRGEVIQSTVLPGLALPGDDVLGATPDAE